MRGEFLSLTCRLPREAEEQLPLLLSPWPVLGCEVRDVAQGLEVTVYLEPEEKRALPKVRELLLQLGAEGLQLGLLPPQDWLAEYRRLAVPQAVGERFWVDPHPQNPTPPPEGRFHLLIEPRQAFGTGSHESTQLLLLLLEAHPPVGAKVLDVGTGSGILALAAKALGAQWVVGFDIDLEAVFVAAEVAHLHPQWPLHLVASGVRALAPRPVFQLILANMLPEQFLPLLPRLRHMLSPEGRLFLSGILLSQRQAVEAELHALSLKLLEERVLSEWVAFAVAAA